MSGEPLPTSKKKITPHICEPAQRDEKLKNEHCKRGKRAAKKTIPNGVLVHKGREDRKGSKCQNILAGNRRGANR